VLNRPLTVPLKDEFLPSIESDPVQSTNRRNKELEGFQTPVPVEFEWDSCVVYADLVWRLEHRGRDTARRRHSGVV